MLWWLLMVGDVARAQAPEPLFVPPDEVRVEVTAYGPYALLDVTSTFTASFREPGDAVVYVPLPPGASVRGGQVAWSDEVRRLDVVEAPLPSMVGGGPLPPRWRWISRIGPAPDRVVVPDVAPLLSDAFPDVFGVMLGELAPGDVVTARLEIVVPVDVVDGRFRLALADAAVPRLRPRWTAIDEAEAAEPVVWRTASLLPEGGEATRPAGPDPAWSWPVPPPGETVVAAVDGRALAWRVDPAVAPAAAVPRDVVIAVSVSPTASSWVRERVAALVAGALARLSAWDRLTVVGLDDEVPRWTVATPAGIAAAIDAVRDGVDRTDRQEAHWPTFPGSPTGRSPVRWIVAAYPGDWRRREIADAVRDGAADPRVQMVVVEPTSSWAHLDPLPRASRPPIAFAALDHDADVPAQAARALGHLRPHARAGLDLRRSDGRPLDLWRRDGSWTVGDAAWVAATDEVGVGQVVRASSVGPSGSDDRLVEVAGVAAPFRAVVEAGIALTRLADAERTAIAAGHREGARSDLVAASIAAQVPTMSTTYRVTPTVFGSVGPGFEGAGLARRGDAALHSGYRVTDPVTSSCGAFCMTSWHAPPVPRFAGFPGYPVDPWPLDSDPEAPRMPDASTAPELPSR